MVTKNKVIKLSADGFIKFGVVKNIEVADTIDEALQLACVF